MESKKAKFTQKTNDIFNVNISLRRGNFFVQFIGTIFGIESSPIGGGGGFYFFLSLHHDTTPYLHFQSIFRKHLRFV